MEEASTGSPLDRARRLATLIKRLRLERNLSRPAVARQGGFGPSTLSQLEHVLDGGPLVGLPLPDTLRAIARGLATNGLGTRDCEQMRQIYGELMVEVGYSDPLPPTVVSVPRVVLDRLARLGGAEIEFGLTSRPWTEADIANVLRAIEVAERQKRERDNGAGSHTA